MTTSGDMSNDTLGSNGDTLFDESTGWDRTAYPVGRIASLLEVLAALPTILFVAALALTEGHLLTATTDSFIPFLRSGYYWSFLSSPIHPETFGTPGGGSNTYAVAFMLQALGVSPAAAQHAINLFPILVAYPSARYLFHTLRPRTVLGPIFANFYVFSALGMNQWGGSTGLTLLYGFTPLVIVSLLRFSRSTRFNWRWIALSGIIIFAAGVDETLLFVVILAIPIVIRELLLLRPTRASFKSFAVFLASLVIAVGIYLGISLYDNFPWILATLGVSSPYTQSLAGLRGAFLSPQVFAISPFSGVFPNSVAALSVPVYVYSPNPVESVLGVAAIGLMVCTLLFRSRKKEFVLSIWLYLLGLTGLLFLITSDPVLASSIFYSGRYLLFPLIALNSPGQWWYVLAPWELVLIFMGTVALIRRLSPPIALSLEESIQRQREEAAGARTFSVGLNKLIWARRTRAYSPAVVAFVIGIVLISSVPSIPGSIRYVDPSSSEAYSNSGGTYSVPNGIPTYFVSLENNFSIERSATGPFRVMWFPTSPGVSVWLEADPYAIVFPPANPVLLSYFTAIMQFASSGASQNISPTLNEMGIKYLVILPGLNENFTSPTVGYYKQYPYALLGNPAIFEEFLSKQPSITLINRTAGYSLYVNLAYSSYATLDLGLLANQLESPITVAQQNGTLVPLNGGSNSSNHSPAAGNLLIDPDFANGTASWAPLGAPANEWRNSASGGGIYVAINSSSPSPINLVSPNLDWNSSANFVPVLPNQTYAASGTLKRISGSGGFFAFGASTYNFSGAYVDYLQPVTVSLGEGLDLRFVQNFTAPSPVFEIWPYFQLFGNFTGTILLQNLSLSLSSSTGVSGSSLFSPSPQVVWPTQYLASLRGLSPNSAEIGFVVNNSLTSDCNDVCALAEPLTSGPGTNGTEVLQSGPILRFLVPALSLVPAYGVVSESATTLTLRSTSLATGSVFVPAGSYIWFLKVAGPGAGLVSLGGNSMALDLSGPQLDTLVINSTGEIERIDAQAYSGTVFIRGFALISEAKQSDASWYTGVSRSCQNEPTASLVESSFSNYAVKVDSPCGESTVLVLPNQFYSSWKYTASNGTTTIGGSAIEVNGWETGFVLEPGSLTTVGVYFDGGPLFTISAILQPAGLAVTLIFVLASTPVVASFFAKIHSKLRAHLPRPR